MNAPAPASASDRPNVILICTDQWRGDCLGVLGHPVVETPHLDMLASTGVVFRNCYSATPSCIPARAALLTGLSQRTHGRVGYRDGVPWNYDVTLPGEFTRNGYQTECVGKMHVYPERSQLGFQHVTLHDGFLHHAHRHHPNLDRVDDYVPWLRQRAGHDADYAEHGMSCNGYTVRPWPMDEHLHPTNWVTSESINFIRNRDPRKPFFLMTSYHRPHPPLDPPAWAFEQYRDVEMPDPPVGDWVDEVFGSIYEPHNPLQPPKRMPARQLQRARAGYYGHLTHIDHQVHRLFETLNAEGLLGNTWIVFVSDHGDFLGDHNLYAKTFPYEGAARVPLFICPPAGTKLPGRTAGQPVFRDEPVELRDVMPTLLDLAGLDVPASVEGRSTAPLWRDAAKHAGWRTHLHGEHTTPLGSVHYVTDGGAKYVWFARTGREQLFDLTHDREERTNLAGDPAWRDRLAAMRQALIDELTGREEGFVVNGALQTVDEVDPVRPALREQR